MVKAQPQSSGKQFYPLLLMLFVLSGCSALIYEVVWFQMLQLVIGVSAFSLGVLLATYMGGMFLGSLLLTRLVPQTIHPLRVYALLEVGIGVIGMGVLAGTPLIDQIYVTNAGGYGGILLRAGVCGVTLLLPTILMGATLPAIARWVEKTPEGISWLGFLYSGNIVGAVCGCLLAGFYFLRLFDVSVATYVAAAINFGVAATSWLLAKRAPYDVRASAIDRVIADRESGYCLICLVAGLSGLCSFGAEVVWTRLLSYYIGNSVYVFSIILAVFLLGLGIGSSAGSHLAKRIGHAQALLGFSQLLLTGAIAWAAFAITHIPSFWPVQLINLSNPWIIFAHNLLQCLIAVAPAAFLWGASFPLALASVSSPCRDSGKVAGDLYAANTLGCIIGALSFSIIVIPQIGTQQAQRLMVGLAGAAAAIMFVLVLKQSRISVYAGHFLTSRKVHVGALLSAIVAMVLFATIIPVTPWSMVAGPFLSSWSDRLVPGVVAEKDVPLGGGPPDIYCIYLGEGMSESVVVIKRKDGVRCYYAAGKSQATSDPKDMRLQRMLGHISALAVDNPKSVLVVACGAGVTAGTYVLYPTVKRIVICELEKLVPQAVAPLFAKENYGVVNDPRTQVVIDDGRHFVRTAHEKFDVITSDPVDPYIKGTAALYTEEYFRACRNHLNPGGVMALWIPFYGTSTEATKSLLAAFFKVFPEGIIWSNEDAGRGYDAVLFGQAGPAQIDIDKVQARLDRPDHLPVAESLKEVCFNSAADLFGTFAGYGPMMQGWLSDAQVNTDHTLRLQFLSGMSFVQRSAPAILNEILLANSFPEGVFQGSKDSLAQLRKLIRRGEANQQMTTTK